MFSDFLLDLILGLLAVLGVDLDFDVSELPSSLDESPVIAEEIDLATTTTTQLSTSSAFLTIADPTALATLLTVPDEDRLETAVVTRVVDGDTIELQDGRKVRYIGIDTPETKHPQKGVECFGQEASNRNSELVLGKTIQLEKDVSETDRYGRLLRYIWVDGVMINAQLLLEGYAQASSYPPDVKNQAIFSQLEEKARTQQSGLWHPLNCTQLDDSAK